jgi:hypothetical protein
MNNPDEETAVAQFGGDDKYFGICMMMATMPGLPMFGHGQVEGFAEKYGMEYQRAYWDEHPDDHLVQRHEREIFPLLRRRYLFAEAGDFLLYDFFTPAGHVNEDVFAYSNRAGDERALVVYHNKYAEARGWIRTSVAYLVKKDGGERTLSHRNLGQGLGLHADADHYCIFRDQLSNLEYIRSSRELCQSGLYVELGAYKYHVFLEFREVQDNEWHQYAHLTSYLNGRGVPSIEEALQETLLRPVHYPFKDLVNAESFRRLMNARITKPDVQLDAQLLDEIEAKTAHLLREIKGFTGDGTDEGLIVQEIRRKLEAILQLPVLDSRFPGAGAEEYNLASQYLSEGLSDHPGLWGSALGWLFVHSLGKILHETGFEGQSRSWIDEWLLGKIIASTLCDLGLDEATSWRAVAVIKILTTHQRWLEVRSSEAKGAYGVLESWLKDSDVQGFLQVNRYQGVLWFNQESFEELSWWMLLLAAIVISADPHIPPSEVVEEIFARYDIVQQLLQAQEQSEYQVERLLTVLDA